MRIYCPAKSPSQSGLGKTTFAPTAPNWRIEFETQDKWINALMGWTSTADPLVRHCFAACLPAWLPLIRHPALPPQPASYLFSAFSVPISQAWTCYHVVLYRAYRSVRHVATCFALSGERWALVAAVHLQGGGNRVC